MLSLNVWQGIKCWGKTTQELRNRDILELCDFSVGQTCAQVGEAVCSELGFCRVCSSGPEVREWPHKNGGYGGECFKGKATTAVMRMYSDGKLARTAISLPGSNLKVYVYTLAEGVE